MAWPQVFEVSHYWISCWSGEGNRKLARTPRTLHTLFRQRGCIRHRVWHTVRKALMSLERRSERPLRQAESVNDTFVATSSDFAAAVLDCRNALTVCQT